MTGVKSVDDFNTILGHAKALLVYFSHDKCNICHTLKPKTESLFTEHFPEISLRYCNIERHPDISGMQQVFAVPTIILFLEGKEYNRYSRHFSLQQVYQDTNRVYQLLLG